ncbi:MAG: PEP-CTERM sorting domain-containing protein [Luteitalea sp.]|nr:PEP-CTERM sorting domain-containing protein [Luteitalea sp.]
MHAELTAWSHNNELGWYDPFTGEHHQLLSVDTTVGDTVRVTLPSVFGFYYYNTTFEQAYYTQSSWNDGGMLGAGSQGYAPGQQFALFNEEDYWWLGIEDLFGPLSVNGCAAVGLCSDWDYNDMVVRFEPVSVPEPGMTALLGVGLLGLAFALRRKTSSEL